MDLKELQTQFAKSMQEMADIVKARDEEVKALGAASEKTLEQFGAVEKTITDLAGQVKDALAELAEMKADGQRLSQGSTEFVKSFGSLFVASEQYKEFIAGGDTKSARFEVGSFHKSGTLVGDAAGGYPVDALRAAGIQASPQRQMRLRDLFNSTSVTGTNAIEYVQELGYAPLCTTLTADVSGGATSLPLTSIAGTYVSQVLVLDDGTNTEEVTVASIDAATNTVTVSALVNAYAAADTEVTAQIVDGTAESYQKPQGKITYSLETCPIRTIATGLPVSRQVVQDEVQLQANLDTRVEYGVKLAEEFQILYGNPANGNQIQGILTNPNVQSYLQSSGPASDTELDAIRRAMTLVQIAEYPVDGLVVNPADWEKIELAKGSDDHYIWVNVADGGVQRVWRVPVIVTTAINAGDFLVGAFSMGAHIWDREEASIRLAEQHEDFFMKNMVQILAEERLCMTTYRPESFVYGKFDV